MGHPLQMDLQIPVEGASPLLGFANPSGGGIPSKRTLQIPEDEYAPRCRCPPPLGMGEEAAWISNATLGLGSSSAYTLHHTPSTMHQEEWYEDTYMECIYQPDPH